MAYAASISWFLGLLSIVVMMLPVVGHEMRILESLHSRMDRIGKLG